MSNSRCRSLARKSSLPVRASQLLLNLLIVLLCTQVEFSKAALFDGCDHTYQLSPGYSYLQSPYYPSTWPPNTSCRYKFVAPLDHYITANCTINLNKTANSCSTEYFYVATDGDVLLRGSEQFCGQGSLVRQSLFREIVLAYASYGSYGLFSCSLFVAPQPCDCGWSVNTRIVNGQPASINEYPSVVALRDITTGMNQFCSGSIITHRHILTAAHCTRQQPNPANIIAYVGDHNLASTTESRYAATHQILQIIEHPSYTSDPVNNDIAILRTTTNIEWSRGVGPICLPPSTQSTNSFAYNYVDVIGWGTTSFGGPVSNVLQKITLLIVENPTCASTYEGTAPIYSTQMCTYDYTGSSRDSCQYDSGGPNIYRGARQFLLGIISFGKICGQGGYAMGVNTRITTFLPWIQANAGTTCNRAM